MKPKKSEASVVSDCRWLLDNLRCYDLLDYRRIHVPIAKPGDYVQAGRAREMAGHADMEIYLPAMRVLHIEFKSSIGKQRPAQVQWQKDLTRIGHKYYVVRSSDEMKDILRENGVTSPVLEGNLSHRIVEPVPDVEN